MDSQDQIQTSADGSLSTERRGVIFDATEVSPNEAISYFGSMAPLASGAVVAGWQNGPAKHAPGNTIRLARSRDGGETWTQLVHRFATEWKGTPGSLSAAEMVEVQPGRLLLFTTWFDRSDPERPLFDPVTEGILRSRQLLTVSADEGDSWSDWQELDTAGLTGCAITGPAIRWSDGTIAFAYESFKEYDDPNPPRHGAWLNLTRDGGHSFGPPRLVAQDPQHEIYYWDQRICPTLDPGGFVALFWTHHRTQQRDLCVHMLKGNLNESVASQPFSTGLSGQIAAPCLTDDGRLLALVVDRGSPGTMKLWQSHDGGQSWPAESHLVVHVHDERAAITQGTEQIDFAAYWEDMGKWSFGHPAIRQIGDNCLLTWYAGTPTRMSLHWARVALHR